MASPRARRNCRPHRGESPVLDVHARRPGRRGPAAAAASPVDATTIRTWRPRRAGGAEPRTVLHHPPPNPATPAARGQSCAPQATGRGRGGTPPKSHPSLRDEASPTHSRANRRAGREANVKATKGHSRGTPRASRRARAHGTGGRRRNGRAPSVETPGWPTAETR